MSEKMGPPLAFFESINLSYAHAAYAHFYFRFV